MQKITIKYYKDLILFTLNILLLINNEIFLLNEAAFLYECILFKFPVVWKNCKLRLSVSSENHTLKNSHSLMMEIA